MGRAQTRTRSSSHLTVSGFLLAAIVCSLSITGCGSSRASTGAGGPLAGAAGIRFSACMRAHGVPNFPDPSPGGGIHIPDGSTLNPQAPAFQAARRVCSKLLPGGGPGSRHASKQDIAQMLKTSVCMRRHGVTGFPDPTLSLPSRPAGYSQVEDRGGVVLAIPSSVDLASPVFKHAASACGFG